MKKLYYNLRKLTLDDLSISPECFQKDEHYVLCRHLIWGILFPENDNPHYFMHNMEPDKYRWAGFVRMGDGALEPQTEAHVDDLAIKDIKTDNYGKISDNPVTYQQHSDNPYTDIRFMEDYAIWKEGNVLDVKAEYWPLALISHKKSPIKGEYFHQYVTLTGTYEGKPIKGLGCFDRLFAPVEGFDKAVGDAGTYYISSFYSGIRKDGRKELFYGMLPGTNGYGLAAYWLEGEEPVLSDELYLETEWKRLPYVPEGDTSCSYEKAVWKFADKEIHIDCQWGFKGFTATPRLDRVGYTHSSGKWYEGKIPYEHELFHSLNENMACTSENLRRDGFTVNKK